MSFAVPWVIGAIFKTVTVSAAIKGALITGTLTLLQKSLTKTPKQEYPSIDLNRISQQAPYPSRRELFGDGWLAPQPVWSRNGNDYGGNGQETSNLERSAIITYAVCDHPFRCYEFKVNSQQFLASDYQQFIRDRDSVLITDRSTTFSGTELVGNNFPVPRIEYDTTLERDVRHVGTGGEHTQEYIQASKRAEEALVSRGGTRSPIIIITKFLGNCSADTMTTSTEQVDFTYDEATPAWENISFGKMVDNMYNYALAYRLALKDGIGIGAINTVPQREAVRFYRQAENPRYTDLDMHFYGTAMMEIVFPTRYDNRNDFVWGSEPNILIGGQRELSSLKLWDPTIPGNPPINSKWAYNNAALCAYHYINKYTDYGNPISGHARINLDSVARAATVCHEKRYTANGVINIEFQPLEVLRQFEYAMGSGDISERAGVLYMHAGQYTPPVYGYDDDEIEQDSWEIEFTRDRINRPGIIDFLYTDAKGDRQAAIVKHPRARENLAISESELLLVNNSRQASHVAYVENARNWDSSIVKFTLNPYVPPPNVWETITMRTERLGFSGLYRVLSRQYNGEDGSSTIVAQSEHPSLYDPVVGEYIPPPAVLPRRDDSVKNNLLLGEGHPNPGYMLVRDGDRIELQNVSGDINDR